MLISGKNFKISGKHLQSRNIIPWMVLPLALLLIVGFLYSENYPKTWNEKNKKAYEKVESERAQGKISKPNDKTRHAMYKRKIDKELKRTKKNSR